MPTVIFGLVILYPTIRSVKPLISVGSAELFAKITANGALETCGFAGSKGSIIIGARVPGGGAGSKSLDTLSP
jgi:hypothetical protein